MDLIEIGCYHADSCVMSLSTLLFSIEPGSIREAIGAPFSDDSTRRFQSHRGRLLEYIDPMRVLWLPGQGSQHYTCCFDKSNFSETNYSVLLGG